MMKRLCAAFAFFLVSVFALAAGATQTENFGIRVLPVPGPVTIDGKSDDWDLSGGVFACDDVENGREQFATWIHAMYDADNLFVLAHFIDSTPLNNPGQVAGDYGFAGDCLQFRTITHPGTTLERGEHFTCWRRARRERRHRAGAWRQAGRRGDARHQESRSQAGLYD